MNLLAKCLAVSMFVLSFPAFAEGPALTEAAASLRSAQTHFAQCKNGKLQAEFGPTLERLESSRKSFEKGRRELEVARRSLETVRKRIEAGHDAKNERYVEVLASSYTAPMQSLAPLVKSYVDGINGYAGVMERYATFCAQPGITTASARQFVSSLETEVAALDTRSSTLVASAAKVAPGDVAAR
ncbi:MAG: hypothetical protein ACO1OB_27635 [Archangium sp.]